MDLACCGAKTRSMMLEAARGGERALPRPPGASALKPVARLTYADTLSNLQNARSGQYYDHMTRILSATEAKAKFLALLDEVEHGDEIAITRHGVVIARLSPARGPHALRGMFKGITSTADPDDDLLSTGETWDLP